MISNLQPLIRRSQKLYKQVLQTKKISELFEEKKTDFAPTAQ